jgi:hypothetical protein
MHMVYRRSFGEALFRTMRTRETVSQALGGLCGESFEVRCIEVL